MSKTKLLAVVMFAIIAFSARAGWTQENVTMTVGETRTLYLPSSITSLVLHSSTFYSAGNSYVTVVSYMPYSVTVKALKATPSAPIVVRCDYYYFSGSLLYSGAHDFLVTVNDNNSGGSGGGSGSGSSSGGTDITSLSISPSGTVEMKKGQTYLFSTNFIPSNANPHFEWWPDHNSSSPSIISVNPSSDTKSCAVTALATGTTLIYVGCANQNNTNVYYKYATIVITADATGVSLYPSNFALNPGETATVEATLMPIDATSTISSWTSMNPNVATVTGDGGNATITAVAPGCTEIKVATDNGCFAYCTVVVNELTPTSFSIPSTLNLTVGETTTITPTMEPDGAVATVSWQSAKPSVASVNSNGEVTAIAPGEATIIASTDNGLTAFCNVTVSQDCNPCDVNGDGAVTSADVTAIYDILLGISSLPTSAADVNNDGEITSADITALYNFLLGNN